MPGSAHSVFKKAGKVGKVLGGDSKERKRGRKGGAEREAFRVPDARFPRHHPTKKRRGG